MTDTVIKVENLSKQYRLGVVGTGTISHDLNRWWYKVRGKEDPYLKVGETNDRTTKGESEYAWALKDINFEVKQGEVLGIIGKNGAGKSTLLKLLSRVTTPTTGEIKTKGRIASLLEVGTGFHPELTGRDNIFLNGAILGMTKAEIRRKFDEILSFSGTERYIDTPVKRYSSGMRVRLAFAVAAHLEPEILIVDEVLAVGDAEFQRKAIGKMQSIAEEGGRTVLFVSHNMQAITSLTSKVMVIDKGVVNYEGNSQHGVEFYLNLNSKENEGHDYNNTFEGSKPTITSIKLKTSHPDNYQEIFKRWEISFEIETPYGIEGAALSFQIVNSSEVPVLHVLNLESEVSFCRVAGKHKLSCIIPNLKLYPDKYKIIVHFANNRTKEKYSTIENVCFFNVEVFGEMRDFYWKPKNAVYVEEVIWKKVNVNLDL